MGGHSSTSGRLSPPLSPGFAEPRFELADLGAAILFYSTDYDELIGCCDRVAVMYDGSIVRELEGGDITEQAIIASALAIEVTGDGAKGAAS